jgi:hypothetical protein
MLSLWLDFLLIVLSNFVILSEFPSLLGRLLLLKQIVHWISNYRPFSRLTPFLIAKIILKLAYYSLVSTKLLVTVRISFLSTLGSLSISGCNNSIYLLTRSKSIKRSGLALKLMI